MDWEEGRGRRVGARQKICRRQGSRGMGGLLVVQHAIPRDDVCERLQQHEA